MDESEQRQEAAEFEKRNSREGENEGEAGEFDAEAAGQGVEEEETRRRRPSSSCVVESSSGTELTNSSPETLGEASVNFGESDEQSHQLSEVPALPVESAKELKDEFAATDQKVSECFRDLAGQATQAQRNNQLLSFDSPSTSLLLQSSITQSISSIPCPSLQEKGEPVDNRGHTCLPEVDKQKSSTTKLITTVPLLETPPRDAYNWRKYGQKQVKSPQGSRSYYRCTYSDCCAKKIECSDHSNRVIEIVYRSQHNHVPPQKLNSPREIRNASSVASADKSSNAGGPVTLSQSTLLNSSKEPLQDMETRKLGSGGSNRSAGVTEQKRRLKKNALAGSGSVVKPSKKQKFVVHTTADVGISGDGYRWRKYGQKMVKGKPHPRNYYRCTSAGCPVRKQIEMAVDSRSDFIITYKGMHDHDMPVPKKCHGFPSAPLVAATAPVSMNTPQVSESEISKQTSDTQWSVDKEGELTGKAVDIGGEKATRSAKTLLSIGFEIKPC